MSVGSPAKEASTPVPLRTASLTSVVEREVERLILGGELKPGERINEFQLANRFGMSRGPLREAMRSLSARGLVTVVRNRGVFVRQIPIEEALEIYDLRSAVFGLAGRLLADRLTDKMLAKLQHFLSEMDEMAAKGDFDAYYPKNLEFHAFLISSAGSRTLEREYRSFVDRLHLCRAQTLVQVNGLNVSDHEHREMVDALASGNVARAHDAFFRHVQRAKLRFMSTVRDARATCLHYLGVMPSMLMGALWHPPLSPGPLLLAPSRRTSPSASRVGLVAASTRTWRDPSIRPCRESTISSTLEARHS